MSEPRDRFDAELSELLGDDPELLGLAQLFRESRPEPDLDPRFPAVLRARLMAEAEHALAPRRRFSLRLGAGGVAAWGTFAVGAALAAAAVVAVLTTRSPAPTLAVVAPNVNHQQSVDPHQAITLSFNQPMDEQSQQSVLAALRIQPATQVTVAWRNPETLVLTPAHPLAADTDYLVTLPRTALHSQSGQTLTSDVTIQFGTQVAPTPSPTATPLPALQPAAVGSASTGGIAFWGPGGAPGVTSSTAAQPTPTASATPSTSPSSTATASPSATPGSTPGSPAAAGAAAAGAVVFPTGQAPVTLSGTAASAVAVSPNGLYVALALTPSGGGDIVVEHADGTHPGRVWPAGSGTAAPVTDLAWDGNNRIDFVTAQGIFAVDLDGQVSALYAFPSGGSASGVVLAPDGLHAFVPSSDASPDWSATPAASSAASPSASASPAAASASASPSSASPSASPTATPPAYPPAAGDGWLLALPTGSGQAPAPTQLAGSAGGVVAFSGSGDEVAWEVNGGEADDMVLEAPVASPAQITQVPDAPIQGIDELALDAHGTTLAYGLDLGGVEVQTSSGVVLGTSPDQAGSLALSPDGTRLVLVAAGSLDVAEVQSGHGTGPAPSLCQGAGVALTRFVDDQVAHDMAGLAALSAPGAPPAMTLTPPSVTRGYVISSACTTAGGGGTPVLTASARLIVDPAGTSSVQLTDESVVLGESGGQWLVSGLSVPALHDQGGGPQVLSVGVTPPATGSSTPGPLVTVTFDSDLDVSSVTATTLWLETSDGQLISLLGPPSYDANTREATLAVTGSLPAAAKVVVGTSLSDIDGGHPAAQVTYPIGG